MTQGINTGKIRNCKNKLARKVLFSKLVRKMLAFFKKLLGKIDVKMMLMMLMNYYNYYSNNQCCVIIFC
jgi:hypothetical protein